MIYSYNKSQQVALFFNHIFVKNSKRFGQIYCPSSRVLIQYSQQLVFVILLAGFLCMFCYNIHVLLRLPYTVLPWCSNSNVLVLFVGL